MRAIRSVVGTFLLIGAVVLAAVEVRRQRARAEAFVAADDFSGERAFRDLEELVKLGPRPPGSQALEEARKYITRQLSSAGAEVQADSFVVATPAGDIPMTNLVGVFQGERPAVVMVAGHYDTA